VAELMRRHADLDWERLMERAAALRNRRAFVLGLVVAHTLLDSPLPEPVRRYAQRVPAIPRLVAQVYQVLFAAPDMATLHPARVSKLQYAAFILRLQASIRDKVLVGMEICLAPSSRDWHILSLPRPLLPLYAFLRPLRMLGEFLALRK
jgi:hypothetical protein